MPDQHVHVDEVAPVAAAAPAAPDTSVDMRMFLELQQQTLELQRVQATAFLRQSAALEVQTDRTAPKDNPHYVPNSYSINPATGEKWTVSLKCEMYDGPSFLNRTPMTEEEVRQANRLEPLDKGYLMKNDGSRTPAHIAAKYTAQGTLERLTIHRPIGKDDNPQVYPSLGDICRQLADQIVESVH